MMMFAFITSKSGLVPLLYGCSQIELDFYSLQIPMGGRLIDVAVITP